MQAQLRRRLVDAILEGRIRPGSPLPSCRQLSANLGIARNTVALAYRELVNEGFLIAAERLGFSSIATEKIAPGIKLLAEVMRAHRNGG